MTNGEREKVLKFMDKGTWKNTWHMKCDQWGRVNMLDHDNIERIRGEIESARGEAKMLMINADAVERIMDQSNNEYMRINRDMKGDKE